ncbi:MAG: alpha/beta fold hydrolase [Dehalococcoidia bacterium]
MNLPEDRYTSVDGHRLRYWDEGSGPPLLLLHGLGNSTLVWHQAMAGLAQRFRVVAVDLPGHGYSDMPRGHFPLSEAAGLVALFMRQVGAERFHVAGNSMGGVIALELGLGYPQRVTGLVLVDSAGLGRSIAWILRILSLPGIGEYLDRPSPKQVRQLLRTILYDPGLISDALVDEMYRQRSRPGAAKWLLRFLRTGVNVAGQRRSIQRQDQLHRLRPPLLILWGRQDRIVPVAHAHAAAARQPAARLHVFDRCGHWPQMEHTDEFIRVVSNFLHAAEGPARSSPAPMPRCDPTRQEPG